MSLSPLRSSLRNNDDEEERVIAAENFSGFGLLPRQDLAYHRFTQYCTPPKGKGMLLLHNVGSGKTITSLSMALQFLAKTPEEAGKQLKIVVVLPTGLFLNFIKELTDKIIGVGNVREKKVMGGGGYPFISSVYLFNYIDREYEISEVLYKNINMRNSNSGVYEHFKNYIKDSVVIFDEFHRMLRPAAVNTNVTLCKDILNVEPELMSECIHFIAMTGTPLNKSISDVKVLMAFVTGVSKYEDRDGTQYEVAGGKIFGQPVIKRHQILSFILMFLNIVFTFVIAAIPLPPYIEYTIIPLMGFLMIMVGGQNGELTNSSDKAQVEEYVGTKDATDATRQIHFIRKIGRNVNIKEVMMLSKINKDELLNLGHGYFKIYESLFVGADNTTNETVVKNLSNYFIENKDDIKNLINIYLDGSAYNISSILLMCPAFLTYILSNIVFSDKHMISEGGKGKKPTKKGRISHAMIKQSPIIHSIGQFFKGELRSGGGLVGAVTAYIGQKVGKELGYKKVTESMNPAYIITQYINKTIYNNFPFDVEKFSKDVKQFISLSDSNVQTGLVNDTYDRIYIPNELEQILENQSTLEGDKRDNASNYLKETPEFYHNVKKTPIKSNYPEKSECCIGLEYTKEQVKFGHSFSEQMLPSTQDLIFSSSFNMLSATKIVGNYSKHVLSYKCTYENRDYTFKHHKPPVDSRKTQTQLKEDNLPPWSYYCTKFGFILANLLFMQTGYMKNYDESYKKDNYIHSQGHFTDKANDLQPNVNPDYDAPYLVTDETATCNYLPIVYSTSDEIGLGIFAGFLKSIGFSYILIHDLDKTNLESQKTKAYKSVLMTSAFKDDPGANYEEVENYFQQILKDIAERNVTKYVKSQPICILLHNAMTEGLDFKYNPGIFLLEVPNTYGDYDQLCGRVLRTYQNKVYNKDWKNFIKDESLRNDDDVERIKRWQLPVKVIYQVICMTTLDKVNYPKITITHIEGKHQVRKNKASIDSVRSNSEVDPNFFGYDALYGGVGTIQKQSKSVTDKVEILPDPIGLYDTTWAKQIYYAAVSCTKVFQSFDAIQWYELLQQKTMFKEFIKILNEPTDEAMAYFEGVTDLEEIINCDKTNVQPLSLSNTDINKPMCKPIPSKLTTSEFETMYTDIMQLGGVTKFKKEYCIGPQLKKSDTAKTIIKHINPSYILEKKNIKADTKKCITAAGNDDIAKADCNEKEEEKLRQALRQTWGEKRIQLPPIKSIHSMDVRASTKRILANQEYKSQQPVLYRPSAPKSKSKSKSKRKARSKPEGSKTSGGGKNTHTKYNRFKNKTRKRKQKLYKKKTIKKRTNRKKTVKRKNNITRRY